MVLELLSGGAIGVFSSFVASKVFLSYTNSKLPTILLSDKIIIDKEGSQTYLVVKLLNKTPNPVIDIKVLLYGVTFQNEDHSISNLTEISKNFIHNIQKYSPENKERPDAIWLGLKVDDEKLQKLKEFEILRLELIARESFYNTFLSIDKAYRIDDVVQDSIFEKGDDMTCRKLPKKPA